MLPNKLTNNTRKIDKKFINKTSRYQISKQCHATNELLPDVLIDFTILRM